jgi:ribokinase
MAGVAVVGSINVDLTSFASPLPRPGETVLGERFSMVLGGKGANQALAAVRAGAPTFLIGAVGTDRFGELARTALRAGEVDTAHVVDVPGDTGIAHIRVNTATAENDIARQVSVVLMQPRALAASALAVTVPGASPSLPTAAAVDEFLKARG